MTLAHRTCHGSVSGAKFRSTSQSGCRPTTPRSGLSKPPRKFDVYSYVLRAHVPDLICVIHYRSVSPCISVLFPIVHELFVFQLLPTHFVVSDFGRGDGVIDYHPSPLTPNRFLYKGSKRSAAGKGSQDVIHVLPCFSLGRALKDLYTRRRSLFFMRRGRDRKKERRQTKLWK